MAWHGPSLGFWNGSKKLVGNGAKRGDAGRDRDNMYVFLFDIIMRKGWRYEQLNFSPAQSVSAYNSSLTYIYWQKECEEKFFLEKTKFVLLIFQTAGS